MALTVSSSQLVTWLDDGDVVTQFSYIADVGTTFVEGF
jgi:hypothetical protein